MRKTFLISVFTFLFLVLSSNLSSATPNWDISGNWTFYNFLIPPGNVANILVVNSFNQVTGAFSGRGYNSNSTFYWTINGTVNGNNITYNIMPVYDNTFPKINATGLIRNSTFMNGSCTAVGYPLCKWLGFGNALDIRDSDNDGIRNYEDRCENTVADVITQGLGTNRWIWNGVSWITRMGGIDEISRSRSFNPTMNYTYGCSCFQILARIPGQNHEDEYRRGCLQSSIELWHTAVSAHLLMVQ